MHATKTLRLRQLQVLHRHGDRTPLRNVFKGDQLAEREECARWTPMLPTTDELAELSASYKVMRVETGEHDPYQTRPFGYLTTTGIQQMTARGEKLEAFPCDTLADRDVQIFSNSYTRTQLSVQALLRGLLHGRPRLAPCVQVLPPDRDIINSKSELGSAFMSLSYAAFPEIAKLKIALEQESDELAFREHEMAPRKAELVRALPMYAVGDVPFTWMSVADYFVCRAAHGVPLIPGTEEHLEASVGHLSFRFHQVCSRSEGDANYADRSDLRPGAFRFWQFYSQPQILRLVAGKLMQNVLVEIRKAMENHREMKKLVVYSGHDISILSVLHTLNVALADDDKWWPDYSSAVVLELLEDENGRWYVRARLDDTILALRDTEDTLSPCDDFHHLIMDKIRGFEE